MADISRAEVATLIEEAYADTLLAAAKQGSTVLSAFQNVPMGTKTTHLPVLATLPEAGWVSESATEAEGVKPQSKVTWADRTLVAEEIAVIIPVHENVIDDATVAVLTEVAELGGQAIGKKLDEAVLFGLDKPASWVSPALLPAAVAAGQAIETVDGQANESDLVGATNQAAELVALAGYAPDTLVSSLSLRYRVANLRDANGQLVFRDESFNGFTTHFNRNGAWVPGSASALIVDSSRVKIGVRQDISVKFLDQATLGTGDNQINLAERDMVALRLKARYAYVLGNGATSMGANKTPVAAVTPDAGSGS
ncbi:major capsid protein [Mycobacterium phage Juliette]|uniref:Major capsid protein n=1 Tax=Mycobacterium phage Eponine TaxID=2708631 RepID=A0A6G6XTH4_9CAUD|nr:major capsid protein [Mycobacterium phage Eponine]QIG61793.1 major capsid protein [Mycobacterium phage Eponine]QTF81621.1 major capsid protein [Mycobacterium phage Juliette]USH45292.1 major capsid protein [Mycobacterium phage Ruthiejr]